MLARVLTLRFDERLGGFDDGPLRAFVKDRQVCAIRDHFFVKDSTPYLAVVVTYQGVSLPDVQAAVGSPKQNGKDLLALLAASGKSGTAGAVLNAANEAAVSAFRAGQIKFGEITDLVTDALSRHEWMDSPTMEELLAADAWARNEVGACLKC